MRELAATGDPRVDAGARQRSPTAISTSASPTAPVFIAEKAGDGVKLTRPADRRRRRRGGQARRSTKIKVNNKLRARHPRRARHADAAAPRPGRAARRRRDHVQERRSGGDRARSTPRSPRRPTPSVKPLMRAGARRRRCSISDTPEADKLAAIDAARRARRPRGARRCSTAFAGLRRRRRSRTAATKAIATHQERRWRSGTPARTSGTASRSARCCCSPRSASPSPSASWASSTWRMARW